LNIYFHGEYFTVPQDKRALEVTSCTSTFAAAAAVAAAGVVVHISVYNVLAMTLDSFRADDG
jgi:hypothetical protein